MVVVIVCLKLEGNIVVGEDCWIGFVEFGVLQGCVVFWLYGILGVWWQILIEVWVYVEYYNICLIGVDWFGIGVLMLYQYEIILVFVDDLWIIVDMFGIDKMVVVGLLGGGLYILVCVVGLFDWVVVVGVFGGVVLMCGLDVISGGLMCFGLVVVLLLQVGGILLWLGVSLLIWVVWFVVFFVFDLYGLFLLWVDWYLLVWFEFKVMFFDDLFNGSCKQFVVLFVDVIVFVCDWGFWLDEVKVFVCWWYGDYDYIVLFFYGEYVVFWFFDVKLLYLFGESYFVGFGCGEEILSILMQIWDCDLWK